MKVLSAWFGETANRCCFWWPVSPMTDNLPNKVIGGEPAQREKSCAQSSLNTYRVSGSEKWSCSDYQGPSVTLFWQNNKRGPLVHHCGGEIRVVFQVVIYRWQCVFIINLWNKLWSWKFSCFASFARKLTFGLTGLPFFCTCSWSHSAWRDWTDLDQETSCLEARDPTWQKRRR